MASNIPTKFPHLSVRQYASVVIDNMRIPCAITDQLYVYIPVLGVCEVIGADYQKEETKIQNDPALHEGLAYLPFSLRDHSGQFRETKIACINLTRLHTWLWGIEIEALPSETMQHKLLIFKRELADLAYAYYGRPMLPQDLKAESQQFLTEEQKSRFEILEQQYLVDHPTIQDENPEQPTENGLTIAVSSEPPQVEFIDESQAKIYREMLGILGRLAEKKKVPGDQRKGYQRIEGGIKEQFGFTYYWTIPANQWEAIVRHFIQVYHGFVGKSSPLPPIFTHALKMKAKPRNLNAEDQPRLF